jgi:hypothetical protein
MGLWFWLLLILFGLAIRPDALDSEEDPRKLCPVENFLKPKFGHHGSDQTFFVKDKAGSQSSRMFFFIGILKQNDFIGGQNFASHEKFHQTFMNLFHVGF